MRSSNSKQSASSRAPFSFVKLAPAKPTFIYDTYWRFAAERQAVFFRRLEGNAAPWTADPILRKYKFTNAYRASDRTSQFLIRHVIHEGDTSATEVFFRIVLFKLFNRIETWELLRRELGGVAYRDYSFDRYDAILSRALIQGRVFSGAYIMPSGSTSFGYRRKHRNVLRLIEQMMLDALPGRVAETHSMQRVFELLRSYPMIGDFLAYQLAVDLNYGKLTDFSEMDFVVPGPGARSGIRKCFETLGGLNDAEIIKVVTEKQQSEFAERGLTFRDLWGRPLMLVDCQNLFCEVDKYARLAHPEVRGSSKRTRIKRMFKPNFDPIVYWYPPKWGINKALSEAVALHRNEKRLGE